VQIAETPNELKKKRRKSTGGEEKDLK